MLRFGFGKHEANWFIRLDLWVKGYRWTFGKEKESSFTGYRVVCEIIHAGAKITLSSSHGELHFKITSSYFSREGACFLLGNELVINDWFDAKEEYNRLSKQLLLSRSNSELHLFMQNSNIELRI
jgi:hypothetical protein